MGQDLTATEYTVEVLRALDDGGLRSAPALRQLVGSAMLRKPVDDARLAVAVNLLVHDKALDRWSGDMFVITDHGRQVLSEYELGPDAGWIVDDEVVMEYTSRETEVRKTMVPVEQLREHLASTLKPDTIFLESGGIHIAKLAGREHIGAGEGQTRDEAASELVERLRSYSLSTQAQSDWALLHLIDFSDNGQLREWILQRHQDEARDRLIRAREYIDAALSTYGT